MNRYRELNRLAAPCCCTCGCVWTPFGCVSACCCVFKITMTQEGIVFNVKPKPFPADAGPLAKTTSDFRSSGMGHRIPGPGWLHPPEISLEGRIHGARKWKPAHLFSCALCWVLIQDGGMRVGVATYSKTQHDEPDVMEEGAIGKLP